MRKSYPTRGNNQRKRGFMRAQSKRLMYDLPLSLSLAMSYGRVKSISQCAHSGKQCGSWPKHTNTTREEEEKKERKSRVAKLVKERGESRRLS